MVSRMVRLRFYNYCTMFDRGLRDWLKAAIISLIYVRIKMPSRIRLG
jgi:hypothetical protein